MLFSTLWVLIFDFFFKYTIAISKLDNNKINLKREYYTLTVITVYLAFLTATTRIFFFRKLANAMAPVYIICKPNAKVMIVVNYTVPIQLTVWLVLWKPKCELGCFETNRWIQQCHIQWSTFKLTVWHSDRVSFIPNLFSLELKRVWGPASGSFLHIPRCPRFLASLIK